MTGGGVFCGAFLSFLRPCLIHRIILELYAAQVQRRAIATSQAKTLPDAAVQLRRLAALLDVQSVPALRLQAALEGQNETVQRLLASALAVVEAAEAPRAA